MFFPVFKILQRSRFSGTSGLPYFLLTIGVFFAYSFSFLLTVGAFCLQWESASNKGLKGL